MVSCCRYTCSHACLYTRTHTCTCTCTHTHTAHRGTHVRHTQQYKIHTYICTCTYTYTHTVCYLNGDKGCGNGVARLGERNVFLLHGFHRYVHVLIVSTKGRLWARGVLILHTAHMHVHAARRRDEAARTCTVHAETKATGGCTGHHPCISLRWPTKMLS